MGLESNECKSKFCLQEFGHILIVNRDLKVVGISEDALKFSKKGDLQFLDAPIERYYRDCLPEFADKHLNFINHLFSTKSPKQIFVETIKNKNYYFDFTTIDDLIYRMGAAVSGIYTGGKNGEPGVPI